MGLAASTAAAAAASDSPDAAQQHPQHHDPDGDSIWRHLPHELTLRVLEHLPPNDMALSGRMACRDAAQRFSQPHHRTVHLSEPLAPHVATASCRRDRAEAAARQLPFRHKLRLLSTAATSGCEVNLAVAWRLVQPCLFRELLTTDYYTLTHATLVDPGTSAVRSGHVHLLPWLVERRCPLLCPARTLAAVAQHCDLDALRSAWQLLRQMDPSLPLDASTLDAAAESRTPDAIPKLQWLLDTGAGSYRLSVHTAAAAARSGDLPRLQWLAARGCPLDTDHVLASALAHADLAVAQWLAEQPGCRLPPKDGTAKDRTGPGAGAGLSHRLCHAAASAARDGPAKLRWVLGAGPGASGRPDAGCLHAAARAGRLEAVRWLVEVCGLPLTSGTFLAAVQSGSVATAEWLLAAGCPSSGGRAFVEAAERGDLAMVRWLAEDAGCSWGGGYLGELLAAWPDASPAHSRDLLAAVRLLWRLQPGPADPRAMHAAAGRGHVPLVRFLHEDAGCAFDGGTLARAAGGGCEALLEWLEGVDEDGELLGGEGEAGGGEPDCSEAYLQAARNGDKATLTCLRQLGVPWGSGLLARAVAEGVQLGVLQWLAGQGAGAGERAVRDAAAVAMVACAPGEVREWLEGLLAEQEGQAGEGVGKGGRGSGVVEGGSVGGAGRLEGRESGGGAVGAWGPWLWPWR